MLSTIKHSLFALLVHFRRSDSGVLVMRAILLLVALIFACTASAQSEDTGVPSVNNPPTKEKSEQTSKDKKNADDQKNTTIQLPPVINVTVSGKLETPAPQAQPENGRQKRNWWEAVFFDPKITDALLVLFTGLLWIATSRLGRIADRQEATARTHERSYVFGNPKFSGEENIRVGDDVMVVHAYRLSVENFGRTPGSVKNVEWKLLPRKDLPEIPVYGEGTFLHHVLHPNQGKEFTKAPSINYRFDWTEPHVVYGRVIYEDVFKDEHRSGFMFLIEKNPDDRGFQHFALADERFSKYYEWD